jgi:hypothetical protein
MQISNDSIGSAEIFSQRSKDILNDRLMRIKEDNSRMENFLNKTRNSLYLSMLSVGSPTQQIVAAQNLAQMHNVCPSILLDKTRAEFFEEAETILGIAAA